MSGAGALFASPLVDGATAFADARFAGIAVPAPEVGRPRLGITEAFLGQAEAYHERFSNTAYFRLLIDTALAHLGYAHEAPRVLDLGSGSGNSVFPLLDRFPRAEVVATDLSPNLLAILKRYADAHPAYDGRLHAVCVDACSNHYAQGAFDLAVGAAILHHLLDPAAALAAVHHALKPDGVALFFEPFENGNAVLMLAYEAIIEQAARQPIRADVLGLLRTIVGDFRLRMEMRRDPQRFASMDDKWIFTKSFFIDAARRCGYASVEILPLHALEHAFRNQTRANLNMGLGLPPEVLPDWAWAIVDHYDGAFSTELHGELLIEGMVLLRK
jgi:SAM-dependent methyltransferase